MSKQSRQVERLDTIRSVSLEDIVNGRHTRWYRLRRRAMAALPIASLAALILAAGGAAYSIWNGPDENTVLVSTAHRPATATLPDTGQREPVAATSAAATRAQELDRMARLPRPRPDEAPVELSAAPLIEPSPEPVPEPVVTGSITPPPPLPAARPASPPRPVYYRSRSCQALHAIAAYLPIRVRCDRRVRAYR